MKSYKSRKISTFIALFIVISLISMLAACGGTTNNTMTTTTTTTASTVDPFAKFDPPITVKMGYAPGESYDLNEGETYYKNVWMDLFATYGIKLDVLFVVDQTQEDTKLRATIASGDYPDIMNLWPVDYQNYSTTGVLADITDMYPKYASTYAYMDYYYKTDGGNALNACYIDGKLHGIPFLTNPYDYIDMLWIRSDWLKNLNLQLPKTMDEVEQLALKFTNNDPDKDGKKNTFGLAIAGKTFYLPEAGLAGFFAAFDAFPGFYNYGANIYIKNPTGSDIIWGGILPGMKDALTMINRMYKAGTIASNFLTMDSAKIIEEIQAGKYGMYFGPTWENYMFSQIVKNNPKADFIQIPIPTQTAGVNAKPFLRNSLRLVQSVSSKCENPEALLKMWCIVSKITNDSIKDPQLKYKYIQGQNGGTYQGYLAYLDTREPLGSLVTSENVKAAILNKDPSSLTAADKVVYDGVMAYDKAIADGTYDPVKNEADASNWLLKKMYGPGSSEDTVGMLKAAGSYTPSMYQGPQTKAITDYTADLTTLTISELLKIITGQQPVSNWDNIVKQYNEEGGSAIYKDINDWYKAQPK